MSAPTPPLAPSRRRLETYPSTRARAGHFALITLVSTAVFYQVYVQGAVSPAIIADFSISLRTFVLVSIVGNAVGALAAWASGLADRFGRVNLVLAGAASAAVLTGLVLPSTTSPTAYTAVYALLSLVGGVAIVATSALVRDFSPQLGRATAMGLWAVGPSLGNLVVSVITRRMLPGHPDWQYHYHVAGAIGAAVFVLAFVFLRELSPALREQVMVSARERALVEHRARQRAGETPAGAGTLGSMWRPVIVIPALGIALFLMFYVTRVGFFVLYFVANFGYTPAEANGLATWYWVANVAALVGAGVLSDRLGVRKPVMLVGSLASVVALAVFAQRATSTDTSYTTFVVLLVALAVAGGMTSSTWLAAFTETVERIDPTATARGLAVYGSVVRGFVVITLIGFMSTVTAAGVLVDQGAKVGALSTTYASELKTLAVVKPATMQRLREAPESRAARLAAMRELRAAGVPGTRADRRDAVLAAAKVPPADLEYLARNGPPVQDAAKRGPGEWQRWWWICLIGQLLVVPLSWRLHGRWSIRAAREDAAAHQRLVDDELRALLAADDPGAGRGTDPDRAPEATPA
ncbi:MFS transporter [Nocardioides sp.]|uniref:MFS transporter n=1 Tax=Nocardioides sp. TaxID=35761 RepID=UPI003516616D